MVLRLLGQIAEDLLRNFPSQRLACSPIVAGAKKAFLVLVKSILRTDDQTHGAETFPKFFPCPACGKQVDAHDILDILEHHQHVISPGRFHFAGHANAIEHEAA